MKTVYLIRHSKAMKLNNKYNFESLQIQNEKNILSIEGEELARKKLVNEELTNLDLIASSNYSRAIGTAKYLTINNNKEIVILPNLCRETILLCSFKMFQNSISKISILPIYK